MYQKPRLKKKNLCGFMPASIEIKNERRGSIFLSFGEFEAMEAPSIANKELFFKDFNNSIDQPRLNKVAEDEDGSSVLSSCKRNGQNIFLSPEKLLEVAEFDKVAEPESKKTESLLQTESVPIQASSQKVEMTSSVARMEVDKAEVNRREKFGGQHCFILDNQSRIDPNSPIINDPSVSESPVLPLNAGASSSKHLMPKILSYSDHLSQKLQSSPNG